MKSRKKGIQIPKEKYTPNFHKDIIGVIYKADVPNTVLKQNEYLPKLPTNFILVD